MSSLVDELTNPPKPKTFREWLILQTPANRAAVEAALKNTAWSAYALVGILRKHGAPVSTMGIEMWRTDHGIDV